MSKVPGTLLERVRSCCLYLFRGVVIAAIAMPSAVLAEAWLGPYSPANNLQQAVCYADDAPNPGAGVWHIVCKANAGVGCIPDSSKHVTCTGSRVGVIRCGVDDGGNTACDAASPELATCADVVWDGRLAHGCREASPGLRASSASLAYPVILVGERSAAIANDIEVVPEGNVVVTGVSTTGDFAVVSESCTGSTDLYLCSVSVAFAPTTAGQRIGQLTVKTNVPTGDLVIPLEGTGETAVHRQFEYAFPDSFMQIGDARVGEYQEETFAFVNRGNSTGQVLLSIAGDEFRIVDDGCSGRPIRAYEECSVRIRFSPRDEGWRNGLILAEGDFDNLPASFGISGDGLPARIKLSASSASLDFGAIFGSGTRSRGLSLTNDGELPVTINNIAFSAPTSVFAIGSATACLVTLAPGASCDLALSFAPADYGLSTARLVVTSTAVQSPLTVSLSGRMYPAATTVSVAESRFLVGRVPAGGTSAGSAVTLTNTGPNPLYVDQALPGEPYNIGLGSCASAVAPGAQCTLMLYARPNVGGVFTTVARIPVNTLDLSVPVTLVGFGAAAACP